MSRDARDYEAARLWLEHARRDLHAAMAGGRARIHPNIRGYHAQQAVEKSLKALLVLHGAQPPRNHNLAHLISLLHAEEVTLPLDLVTEIPRMSALATMTRYPGDFEPLTAREARHFARIAENTLSWARAILQTRGNR